jgi:hypothetical protein
VRLDVAGREAAAVQRENLVVDPSKRRCRFLTIRGSTGTGIVAFGIAGLGCSALLPLTIALGEKELTAMAAAVAGGVIAFYQFG